MVIGLVLAIFFSYRISRSILHPILDLSEIVSYVCGTGDLEIEEERKQVIRDDGNYYDEIGQFSKYFAYMMDGIVENVHILGAVSRGDLTKKATLLSEKDTLGNTVNAVVDNLSEMVDEVRISANQIGAAANQLSSGASSLTQSSSEQSATVERLLATANGIADQARKNTKRSQDASDLAMKIAEEARDGSTQMELMTNAISEIDSSSRSISRVLKVINDIAFQTNILALNAAVEAARAGQQGKGFAVVADEVKNLATKSASAASDSNDMITDTLNKSDLGTAIVVDTAEALSKIVDGVGQSAEILKAIALAAEDQNKSIDEINASIAQLTDVVYENTATAQQSAAASEQMSSQTNLLIGLVERFNTGENGDYSNDDAITEDAPEQEIESGPKEKDEPFTKQIMEDDDSKY